MTKNKSTSQMSLGDLLDIVEDPTSSDDMLCEAARSIATLGDERAEGPLLRRLTQYRDPPWVRRELVMGLGGVILHSSSQTLQARDLLLEILSSTREGEEVRAATAIALGQIGDDRAVEPLLTILESEQTDLTYACVTALGNIGDSRAIDALIENLKSDRLLVPQTAARGLAKFGKAAERALPALKELADHGNEVERRYALEAITSIKEDSESKKAVSHPS
jgi:HEAT repeat protein